MGWSIAELAGLIDADPASLEQTVADFGKAASEGHDPMFRRVAETMRAFGDGPFYAIEVMPDILNTQGGPRRNGKAEVLDRDGRPIRTCTRPASSAESPRTCTKAAATWPSA